MILATARLTVFVVWEEIGRMCHIEKTPVKRETDTR